MAKFDFAVFLLFAFFAVNVFGQAWVSYELEGKFRQENGPNITELLTTARADLQEFQRAKRDAVHAIPAMTFTGSITRRSPGEVTVSGVNATLTLTDMRFELEGNGTNRLKRGIDETVRVGFYGQFKLHGTRNNEVLAVKIYLDLKHLSRITTPSLRADEAVASSVEFGFKGKICPGDLYTKVNPILLDLNFGYGSKWSPNPGYYSDFESNRQKRQSRQNRKEVLKIDGELTIDQPWWNGGRDVVTVGVQGEVSLQNIVAITTASPKQLFYAANDNMSQRYFETHGNITGKYNGHPILSLPFGASTRSTVERFREKRNSPNELDSFELEYNGVVTGRYSKRTVVTYGISTKVDFWGISKTQTSDETNSNIKYIYDKIFKKQ